jgi:threonine aldolase
MADRLKSGLVGFKQAREAWPTQANEIFLLLRRADADRLRGKGAVFHDWAVPHGAALAPEPDEMLVRLVTSFATRPEDVDAFLAALAG